MMGNIPISTNPFDIEARSERAQNFEMLIHLPSSVPLDSDMRHFRLLPRLPFDEFTTEQYIWPSYL